MRARNYCAHHNTRDHWMQMYEQMSDLVVCLKRDLQCLRPEASLVFIYRPNVAGMKGRVDLAQPVNRTPDLWCGSTIHYHSILFGSARKGRLDLRFASARCLEIVCGTITTTTSARIVERVTVGSISACLTILRSSFLVVFLVAPDPVFRAWVASRVYCSPQFLTAHSERSTGPATRRVDQPAVFIPMIKPLSNSLNCEKCLIARLPGMFRLPKSSYNRRVIVPFMNLRICTCLYRTLFLIVAPPRRV
ncbi:uncharacterized protein TNCV_2686611 [Trichonephila clavipes]|nr:uncharacterized protein TNCV_2686611 [Trichonephila clavipes]